MPLPFKKPIKKSFKKIIIVKITFSAKTSLLRGTTAILLRKIFKIFRNLFPKPNKRIRRVNINRKIRRLGKHLNHLQLLYIRIQQLKASFCCAKTSLLRGTTAIRGGADTFVFLSHEILGKFRALLFQKKGNRTRQIKQERRIMRL